MSVCEGIYKSNNEKNEHVFPIADKAFFHVQ